MADLGQISNVYDDDPYSKFALLSSAQSAQSLNAGDRAAAYADPFMEERKNQIKRLQLLQSDPGSITTSPFYKFLMDQQMNAVAANNAARGLTKSGRGAMALQDRAAGVASQAYFPLLQNATTLAMSGSSPAAAGIAYQRGVSTSQDQAQMAAAARAAGQQKPVSAPSYTPPPMPTPASTYSGPSASYGLPYSGTTGLGSDVLPNSPGYTPSANAGTGYVVSDYGASDVSGPGSQYYSFGTPAEQPTYAGNENYDQYAGYGGDYGDFGYGGE